MKNREKEVFKTMIARKRLFQSVLSVVASLALLLPVLALGADYPNKTIQLIVPYAAGGATDTLARALAKVSLKHFPVQVVVVNVPRGAGIPGRVNVINSKPDGYTLLFGYGSGEDLVTPHTMKIPYDQFKDLLPVCQISINSITLVIPVSNPSKTLKEYVDWAKKQKREITGAVSTKGASTDITMLAIMKVAGVNAQTIPFKGGAEAVTAVLGGHTDFAGGTPTEVMNHVKAGKLRILGVGLPERDPVIPEVPTFMEQGFNMSTMGAIRGVGVPKGTPDSIIDYLEAHFKKVTEDPEFHSTLKDIVQPVIYRDKKVFLKNMKDGYEVYGKLIKSLGLN
jgi:tripartite-type tricarboxylate transporter receptor subunit TctC